ncbi:MAG: hypothetical protein JWS12_958 [Candidatus Saccharibacteria bacterium]|nr:hypothetical protein [Candidatus Saccharibacteria bacterium]
MGLLIIVAIVARVLIIGSSPVVTLKSAPPLTGAISQSLATAPKSVSQPQVGKDYSIKVIHYLDNQEWAVIQVESTGSDHNSATLVMQKVGTTYHTVLGPGTSFSIDSSQGVPADVVQYLKSQGVLIL